MSTREELQAEQVAQITTVRERAGGQGGGGFTHWKAAGWERAAAEELRSVWFRLNVFCPSIDKYISNHWNVSD